MSYSDLFFLFLKCAALFAILAITLVRINRKKHNHSSASQRTNTASLLTPTAPRVNLRFKSARNLRFQWRDVDGVSHYQLLEKTDKDADFRSVGPYILPGRESIVWTTPLYSRVNAHYILRAFNEHGFTDSPWVSVSTELEENLRYLKTSNIDAAEFFGFFIQLSEGGNTLIIAEDDFSSAYPRIHGTAPSSYMGAAFIFNRIGSGQWEQTAYVNALAKAKVGITDSRYSCHNKATAALRENDTAPAKRQHSDSAAEFFPAS